MMKRLFLLSILMFSSAVAIRAQEAEESDSTSVRHSDSWIHIYRTENKKSRITTAPAEDIKSITYSKTADGYDKLIYETADKTSTVDLSLIDSIAIGANIPTLYITTTPYLSEIQSKDVYVDAVLDLKGYGMYKDVPDTTVQIKGRGNSTWSQFPKKPYRLKFPSKVKLCGMTKAKNYVLLANYIDCSLVRNAIAFKIGQMLDVPYCNHTIPVNVVLNGIYKGSYQMTEKIGINKASVDIEETEGILFELDTNYDEPYKYTSTNFKLPVMVKDPDLDELAALPTATETAQQMFNRWKNDFQTFESAVKSGKDIDKYLDMQSLVDFLLVNNVVGNREPGWPKSVFMYKEKADTTYKMGPLWDFDWTFSFGGNYIETYKKPNVVLFDKNQSSAYGESFFKALIQNTDFKARYKVRWEEFKSRLPELLDFIDEYARLVRPSALQNGEVWPPETSGGRDIYSTETFDDNVERMKTFLQERIDYIDTHANYGFY